MPVWMVKTIEERPWVTLKHWTVYEVHLPGGDPPITRHMVGYSIEDRHGQVSSPIVYFDCGKGRARTSSGRVYQLSGQPGCDPDAQYTWHSWKDLNEISEVKDVSQEVLQEMLVQNSGGSCS